MFGYITISQPDLKFKEYDIYRGYYCGLCESLKNKYGQRARLALSYDLTFLGLLLSALYEPRTTAIYEKCIFHPFKKQLKYQNECLDYAAKMTIVLSYFKCEDDWMDEKKWTSACYQKSLKKAYQAIQEEFPTKTKQIEAALMRIHTLEKQENINLDEITNCFGEVMGLVCSYREDEWQRTLYQLGYDLGRFIYLMDAYDDLEKDFEKKRVNPLAKLAEKPDFESYCHDILEMMMARVTESFEYLPIVENVAILRNILYSGVWQKYVLKQKKEAK